VRSFRQDDGLIVLSVGGALNKGGPAGILLAYLGYSCLLALVSNGCAEMTIHMPVSGGYIRLAGEWVDQAFGTSHLLSR